MLLRLCTAKAAGLSLGIKERTLTGACARKFTILLEEKFYGNTGYGQAEHHDGY